MSTPESGTESAPKSKKKIIIIAVLVVLLAGGGYWFTQMRGKDKHEKPVPGAVLKLDPVSVNLAGGGYLKVGVALQFTADAAGHGEGPDGSKAQDLVIAQFSQSDPARVTTKREEIKAELQKKIVHAYHDEVIEIYYTEYVSQ